MPPKVTPRVLVLTSAQSLVSSGSKQPERSPARPSAPHSPSRLSQRLLSTNHLHTPYIQPDITLPRRRTLPLLTSLSMAETNSPPPIPDEEPKYGGFTRFEIELEFVQSLASPYYLNHLASQKHLENPAFIAYLSYLQYWSLPPYTKYLNFPGPTLKNLELLQQEQFRTEILIPDVVMRMVEEGVKASSAEGK